MMNTKGKFVKVKLQLYRVDQEGTPIGYMTQSYSFDLLEPALLGNSPHVGRVILSDIHRMGELMDKHRDEGAPRGAGDSVQPCTVE